MKPELVVRPARDSDLPSAAALAASLVRLHHALDPRRFAILADPLEPGYERFLRTRLNDANSVVLVAAQRTSADAAPGDASGEGAPPERIVGYAYGAIEPPNWMTLLDASGWIHDLIVAEDARRGGVGRALVREAVRRLAALGARRVLLTTAFANDGARQMYEQLGFRSTSIEMMLEV